jgi:hypothetical protein
MPDPETLPLPFPSAANGRLDIKTLETWLWDAGCSIRGALEAPKYTVSTGYEIASS